MTSKVGDYRGQCSRARRVLVTGGSGFVGRNLVPLLQESGAHVIAPTHTEYDLLEQRAVRRMFADQQPDVVFHLAGLSGGIMANRLSPGDYCQQNLAINTCVMHEAWRSGVGKFITLIGGCSYPALAPSPIREDELWNGYPQPDSAAYSLAKAMSVVMAQAYRAQHGFDAIVLVPGNLYGPFDNFDLQNAHIIPATIRKFLEAKRDGLDEVVAWGSGTPVRDFIYVGDACEAIVLAAEHHSGPEIINISSGVGITTGELVETVAELSGFDGRVTWDAAKPDGQMLKVFDVNRMHERLGFECRTSLRDGLEATIKWLANNYDTARLKSAI